MNEIRIAVDAGHGSTTPGKRTPPLSRDVDFEGDGVIDIKKDQRLLEHVANTNVALFLCEELIRCGFAVVMTGFDDGNAFDDTDEPLSKRQEIIKGWKCDYSISIHFNAYGDGESFNGANGVGVYIHDKYPGESMAFASKVLAYLIGGTNQRNRGISRAGFTMCNCSTMNTKASILIECAFMTNLKEALEMVASKSFWKECAVEITKGVCHYTGGPYVEEENEKNNADSITMKKYRIQAGAFYGKNNARKRVDQIKKAGFSDVSISLSMKGNSLLYKVFVGEVYLKNEADQIKQCLKDTGIIDAYVLEQ